MALHWRPVGPEPASTYWQRRAVVAVAALLPLVLLAMLTGGGDDGRDALRSDAAPTSAASTPAGPSTAASAAPSPSPAGAAPCAAEALKIASGAGEERYRVGTSPRLTLSVTNTGAAPCVVDLGQAAVELRVFSGRDRIWSSDDCKPGGGEALTTLAPGKAEVQRVTWDGRRSLPGCDGSKARAQAGTYRVTARVGEIEANGEPFVFTD